MITTQIKDIASQVFKTTPEEIQIVKRLLGGMSHYTYQIRYDEVDYTIRLIGKGGNLFVNRANEIDNIIRVAPLKLNNETIYFDIESGVKIAKYVEGLVLTDAHIYDHLGEIAKSLKKLHKSQIVAASDYDHINRLALYETFAEQKSARYLDLKQKWLDLYEQKYKDVPYVFCHNDAQRSNMVKSGRDLYLLDWEYAAMNDPYYDIASFGNIAFDDALKLLDVYLGHKSTKEEQDRVRFYRMYQGLQWHQVALYKEKVGLSLELHFDFKLLSEKYLNLAEMLYNEIKG